MNQKILIASLIGSASLLTAAHAAHAAPAGTIELGAQAQVLPLGSVSGNDSDDDLDYSTSFGIQLQGDYFVHPNVSVGLAPRFILGLKPDVDGYDGDSASQLDLAARVTGHAPVAPKVDLFGFVAPGYSFVFLPDEANPFEIDNPSGFIVGLGGGASYQVTPSLAIVGELGYTLGFQGSTVELGSESTDVDYNSNFLHLGLGVKASI
jgi:hypothetical protein